jgi:hypothetical protein
MGSRVDEIQQPALLTEAAETSGKTDELAEFGLLSPTWAVEAAWPQSLFGIEVRNDGGRFLL